MDRQRKADMMLVLATGFWGISNCLIAICLRDMQPVTLNAIETGMALPRRLFTFNDPSFFDNEGR